MRDYASTYPQLMNQALNVGLDEDALLLLRRAHELGVVAFDGFYNAHGVPVLCHFVRTASIVLSERQPASVVVAALLHNAHGLHLFEDSRRQLPRAWHRHELRSRIGAEAEALVWEYSHLRYGGDALLEHLRDLDSYSILKRRVLIIRVANELEGYLDRATAYTDRERLSKRLRAYGPGSAELADRLGLSRLAAELREGIESVGAWSPPAGLIVDRPREYELPRKHFWEMNAVERWAVTLIRPIWRKLRPKPAR